MSTSNLEQNNCGEYHFESPNGFRICFFETDLWKSANLTEPFIMVSGNKLDKINELVENSEVGEFAQLTRDETVDCINELIDEGWKYTCCGDEYCL